MIGSGSGLHDLSEIDCKEEEDEAADDMYT